MTVANLNAHGRPGAILVGKKSRQAKLEPRPAGAGRAPQPELPTTTTNDARSVAT